MLVRGSLTIKKRLQLLNPGGLAPAEGLIALSDAQGNVRWDNLRIPTLQLSSTYAAAGSLVLYLNNVYFSLIPGAEGEHISIPTTWKNLSLGSSDASVFSQDQIDALNLATEPSAGNPYATRNDLQIISLKGTATSANILLKSPSVSNMVWVASTDGLDSYNNIVVSGDGMVSDGDGWLGVGPIRGPRAYDDAPVDGKVYGRKDAAWEQVPTDVVYVGGPQIITGAKTFSEDIIVGSTTSQVYTQISSNTLDVHTGDDTVYGFTRLTAYGVMKFLGPLSTTLNFINPTVNTTIQVPAKAVAGVYTLATTSDFKTLNGESIIGSGDIVIASTSAQNLQSVLDLGASASFDAGNAVVEFFTPQLGGTRRLSFYSQDVNFNSSFSFNPYRVSLSNIKDNIEGYVDIINGNVDLSYYNSTSNVGTNVSFNPAIVSSTLKFPAPAVAGTYILATTADIPFQKLSENTGDSFGYGIIIRGRDALNYGNIGAYAFDLSYSSAPSTLRGATGESSFVTGDDNIGSGYGVTVFGANNVGNGTYSLVTGSNHTEAGFGNALFGAGHSITSGAYATIVGQFANVVANNLSNVNDGGNTMFAIGNGAANGSGTLQSRSTAFQVYKSGAVTAPSLTTAMITADSTGKMLVTKEYIQGAITGFISSNLQRTITTDFSISNADNGFVIVINNGAAPVIITVPAGLMSKIEVGFLQLGTGDVSFVATGTVIKFPATLGLKIKGQNYNSFLMQVAASNGTATNDYNFLGDIKA